MSGRWSVAPACDAWTQDFGCVDNSNEWLDQACSTQRNHHGVDLAGANVQGTPVYSARDGLVVAVGIIYLGPFAVCVLGDDGVYVQYGHMDSSTVSVGERVAAGQQIGTIGSQGRSTGPHLHVEARIDGPVQNNDTSALVNPEPYLQVAAAPVPAPEEAATRMVSSIYYGDGNRHWFWVDGQGNVRHWYVNTANLMAQGRDTLGSGAKPWAGCDICVLGANGEQLHVTTPLANGSLGHWWYAAGAGWNYEEIVPA